MDTTENNSLPKMEGSESEKTLKNILDTNVEGFSEYVYEPLLNIDSSINTQLHELVYEPLFEIYECLVKGFQGISENNFKSRIEEEIRLREKKSAEEKLKKAEESTKKEKDPKKTDRSDISKFLKTGNIFQDTLTGITRGIKDDIMDFTDMEVVSGIKLNQIITPLEKLKDSLDARSEDQILNDKIVDKLDEIKGFQEALDPDKGKSFTDEERKIAESNLEVAKKQLELLEGQKKSQTKLQEESLFKTDSEKVKDAVVSEDGEMKGSELKDDAESFKLPTFQGIKDKFQAIRMGISAISTTLTSLSSGFISLLGPFAPIIGTVAAIAYIGYALYKSVTSMFDVFKETGSVMEALKSLISTFFGTLIALPFDLIKGAISYIADFLGFERFSKILDSFSFVEILTNIFHKILDFITYPFELAFGGIMKIFEGDFKGGLKDIFKGILSNVFAPFRLLVNLVDSIFGTDISGTIAGIFDKIFDFITYPFELAFGGIMKIFEGDFSNGLKDIFKGILNFVFAPFRLIIDLVDSIFGTDISGTIGSIFDKIFDFITYPFELAFGGIMKIFEGDFSGGLKDIFKGILSYMYSPFRLLVNLIDSIFGTDISGTIGSIFDGFWDMVTYPFKKIGEVVKSIFEFNWSSLLLKIPFLGPVLEKMGIGGKEEGGSKGGPKPEKDSGEFVSEQDRRQKRLSMTRSSSMKDTIKKMDLLSDLAKNDKTHSGYEGAEKDRVEYGRSLIENADVKDIDKFRLSKKFNIPVDENLERKVTADIAAVKSLIGDIQKPEKSEVITNARRFFLDNQHLLPKKNLGANLNEKEGALRESNMEMNSPKQSKGDVAVISDSSTKSNSQINITKEIKTPSIGRGRFTR